MNLYRCSDCDYQEERQKPLKKCPKCKSKEFLERTHFKCPDTGKMFLYKYVEVPYVSVKLGDSDLKTLDHLGRRNYERDEKLGIIKEKDEKTREADELAKPSHIGKYKRIKKKKGNAWWRDSDKIDTKLSNLTDKQKQDYVFKGKK